MLEKQKKRRRREVDAEGESDGEESQDEEESQPAKRTRAQVKASLTSKVCVNCKHTKIVNLCLLKCFKGGDESDFASDDEDTRKSKATPRKTRTPSKSKKVQLEPMETAVLDEAARSSEPQVESFKISDDRYCHLSPLIDFCFLIKF